MSDEAFHEIQLNGKQLVFLFMASTVAAVVIFLCGVMVGRGVRAPRAVDSTTAVDLTTDPTALTQTPPPTGPVSTTSSAPQDVLTYPDVLEDPTAPPAAARPPASSPASQPKATQAPVKPADPPAPARATVTPAPDVRSTEPGGNGFVVQVAAVRERSEADTIARRLASKGYPSFVTTPGAGAPRVFRVRVGKYNDRREAATVASRLEKEEQFKPWITR